MGKKKSRKKTKGLKKKKNKTKGIFKRDILDAEKLPEEFEIVGDKIWWEGNPDKSKKYRRKKFEQKEFLTIREAEAFLEITGDWLGIFILGEKGFPKLPYTISGLPSEEAIAKAKANGHRIDRNTIKFSREELEKYRIALIPPKKKSVVGKKFPASVVGKKFPFVGKKFPTNTKPQQK